MSITKSEISRSHTSNWDYWKVLSKNQNGKDLYDVIYSEEGHLISENIDNKSNANAIAAIPLMINLLKHLNAVSGVEEYERSLIKEVLSIAENGDQENN